MRTIEEINNDVTQAQRAGDFEAVLRYAEELADIGTPLAQGYALQTRGQAHRVQGEYEQALVLLLGALDLFRQAGAASELAHTMVMVGFVYNLNGDFAQALETLTQALELCEQTQNRHDVAAVLDNLARVYLSTGDYPKGIEYHSRAQEIHKDLGDVTGVANAYANIGVAYYYLGDYPRALENFRQSLDLNESIGNRTNVAKVTGNIGNAYWSSGDVPQALEYYRRALAIHEEQGDRDGVAHLFGRIAGIHEHDGNVDLALQYYEQSLEIYRDIGDRIGICREMGEMATVLLRLHRFDEAAKVLDEQSGLVMDEPAVQSQYHENRAEISQHLNDLDDALEHLTLSLDITQRSGLKSHVADCHLSLRNLSAKRRDLDAYILHNEEYLRINREITGVEAMRKMAMVDAQRKIDVERMEKERHLSLLYNTLPPAIADRVLKGERVNDMYESVVVLFVDLAGFTRITSNAEPDDVVALLETIFTTCDEVIAHYGLTKIKTIGDAYMAVCFPDDADIVHRSAAAALQLLKDLSRVTGPDGHPVKVRIGVHTGPVIAGIIGTTRMQYDVWGDTVNVASRMESTSEPGRIHVSEAFALALSPGHQSQGQRGQGQPSQNPSEMAPGTWHEARGTWHLALRGETELKGKGTMTTYWLEPV